MPLKVPEARNKERRHGPEYFHHQEPKGTKKSKKDDCHDGVAGGVRTLVSDPTVVAYPRNWKWILTPYAIVSLYSFQARVVDNHRRRCPSDLEKFDGASRKEDENSVII
jgi:hypothetical protein